MLTLGTCWSRRPSQGSDLPRVNGFVEETMILKHTAFHMKTVSYATFKRSINEGAMYVESLRAGEGRWQTGLWRDNLQ